MHRVRERGVGRAGIHRVGEAVHRFVAAGAENRGAENFLCLGVDEDLHEAEGLTLFDRAADLRHRSPPDEERATGGACFVLGHADPPERRIDEERGGRGCGR